MIHYHSSLTDDNNCNSVALHALKYVEVNILEEGEGEGGSGVHGSGFTWWWVLAEMVRVASGSHTTMSASEPSAITPCISQRSNEASHWNIYIYIYTFCGYMLNTLAAVVLVTAT